MSFMDDLLPVEDESVEKILVKLMESGDGIALKTDLPHPLNVVRLSVLADWLQQEQMFDSATLIREFVKYYMEDMVSNRRQGRKEIIRAVSERMKEEERNRWTGKVQNDLEMPR